MTTSTGLRDRAERFLALAEKATPGPWQTRFLYRLFTRVRMSPGDLEFNTKPQADWPDCEFIEAARNDAPDLIRALLASPATAGAEGLRPMPEDDVLRARLLIDVEIVKKALLEAADKFTVFFYNFKDGSPEKEVCESNRKLMREAMESFRRLSAPSPATPPAEAREVVERARLPDEETWLRNLRCPKCACYGYEVGCGTDCEFRSKDWPAEYRALTAAPEVRG